MSRARPGRRIWAGLAAVALAAAQAQAAEPPALRPPHAKPLASTDEGGMWAASDKAEGEVKGSAEYDQDAGLNAYVRSVTCKVASEYCDELRIYVLDRPIFNAAAAPNGYVEVNSGLLLRARTEDELAFVIGHEVSHYARNHSLQSFRTAKTKANAALLLSMAVAGAAAGASYSAAASSSSPAAAQQQMNNISAAARSVNNLIYLAAVASFYAFDREQEAEADRLGLARAKQAGFDPAAGAAMWRALVDEHQASDFPAVRKADVSGSIFRTHPITADRIAALDQLAGGMGAPPDIEAERRYRAAIRAHLADWLKDDLRRRDYGQTLFVVNRLAAEGEDLGVLEYYRGEAYRLRRNPGDEALAQKAYSLSIHQADAPVEAWRQLADMANKLGDKPEAASAYKAYLQHAPQAQDRWLVEASLKSLQNPEGAK